MNYFELYGIPVTMKVDPKGLRTKFYELSRRYHPDFFLEAPEAEQQEMLMRSSDVNKAYKTFQTEEETIRYVLNMKGLLHDEEKYALGSDFLMEVMDINEKLMELEMDPNPELLEEAARDTRDLLLKSYQDVEPIITNYSEDLHSEKELLQVKDYYYRKKYLQRILDKIFQLRNIAGS